MNAVRYKNKNELYSNNMNKPVLWSVLFHITIFVVASVSFPNFVEEIEPTEMAIIVELAGLAEISQTNKIDKPEESKEEQAPKERKPVYNNTDNVPDLLSPKEPEIEDIPEPSKEKPKLDQSIIKNPPKPRNKPRKPKVPRVKPAEVKEDKKPEDQKDFTSLLKSLAPDEPEQSPALEPVHEKPKEGQVSQVADFSKQMTRSELDDLNLGVQPCWNVNSGGKDAQTLSVSLWVFVGHDRTVRDVQIIDQMRYNSDTHFRAAAEAARRALLNHRCSTLNLPPEKYERWKKFKYIFDPSNML